MAESRRMSIGTSLVTRVGRGLSRLRSRSSKSLALAVLLFSATVFLAWIRSLTHPTNVWMAPTYLKAWLFTGLFNAACLVAGWQCLRLLLPAPPRILERIVLAHACGLLLFYLAMFIEGMLGAYGRPLFWLLPLGMIAVGLPRFVTDCRRLWQRHARGGIQSILPRTLGETLALVLIVVALVAIYLQILPPDNISYDSRWYHLPVAEQYVAAGRIHRFDDGWYLGTYPQMASLIYAWALMAPGTFFDHLVLCSHIEYSLLPATLLGFAAMAARIAGGGKYLYSGAAIFLFPSLFIYDASFVTNADHVLAFWVAPVTVALIRFGKRFELREALLVALFTGAAICVKYQSCMLIAPICLYLAWLMWRHRRVRPILLWAAAVGVITSTHWLKNLVYYHDPFYPLLNRILPITPFHAGAVALYHRAYWDPYFLPEGHGWEGVLNALWAALTFPFTRFAKPILTNTSRPIVGALFILLLPTVIFLRHRLRILKLSAAVLLGVVIWYLTSHQDRYLEALVPWMAVVVALVLNQLWRFGTLVRVAVSGLVVLQFLILFSGYFAPTHAMTGGAAIKATVDFLGRPYTRPTEPWNVMDSTMGELHAALPKGAKVLTHPMRLRMGLQTMSLTDEPGWQGAIEYLELDSPDKVAALWRSMGVTHILTTHDLYAAELPYFARELVYSRALQHYTSPFAKPIGGWQILTLKSLSTPDMAATQSTKIGWLVCQSALPAGVYAPIDIVPNRSSKAHGSSAGPTEPALVVEAANALIVRPSCSDTPVRSQLERQFSFILERNDYQLWIRK